MMMMMSLKPLQTFTGKAVALPVDNIDTDQIIPARFLKGTSREGFGQFLFNDWRYSEEGEPNPDFALNAPTAQGATVLVAGRNFGCGSSREHAPWALTDYGFQAILAESFAEIFRNNALKNGLLPIVLADAVRLPFIQTIQAGDAPEVRIDLPKQTVDLGATFGTHTFEIDPFWKACLIQGTDQVGYTLSKLEQIKVFEARHEAQWVYAAPQVL
jgi:3-isopropylmalate/(R)-2-methylmalate dehydratase small subunit